MVVKKFNYKTEIGQNPYIGIMSFQHFRDDKLYSDIVVAPENNMCETENIECYPIPDYVPQNGRSEGFYPDTSVAYFRILWKEFEPERNVYNYKIIDDILSKAKEKEQTVVFRLMPHSTRACDDVPEWLKSIIDCPERPDGKRVKDSPENPLFIHLFLEAVKKIGERYDGNPVFDSIDISLPGAWGEGHKLASYADEDIKLIFDTYLASFKNTQIISQYALPKWVKYSSEFAKIGIRADGLGDRTHLEKNYPLKFGELEDFWKSAPISFESYWWLTEWKRQGWDIDEIIEQTLKWHISSFNPKSLPIPYEWQEKIEKWLNKMGYHFLVDEVCYPEKISRNDKLYLNLIIDNVGVAPIYRKLPLYIKLKGENEYIIKTDADITKWMPGKSDEQLHIHLPENIKKGQYDIEISVFSDTVKFMYFATDAPFDEGYYKVGEIEIE